MHGLEANKLTEERAAAPTAVLFDPEGGVGRSYGAQVTPHMYVITGDGTLVYMGGIDDKPTTRLEDLKTAKNFVDAALSEVVAGQAGHRQHVAPLRLHHQVLLVRGRRRRAVRLRARPSSARAAVPPHRRAPASLF